MQGESQHLHRLSTTVLLVDDDPSHLLLHSKLITHAGFRVVTARVGTKSFSMPERDSPGLILLDYKMNTTLTPPEVVSFLRETFPGVPIVLLSSMLEMPMEMGALVDGFLNKDPERIIDFVRTFFDGGGIAQAATSSSV